ncbi:MAG: hypothetical protein AAB588_06270 [Patescibacteria group bacterium]
MDINSILRFLDNSQKETDTISQSELAELKNFTIGFLKQIPPQDHQYRWRIAIALYLAEMHCIAIHETYLVNGFESVKKKFMDLEKDIVDNLKNDGNNDHRKIIHLQLSYSYRLFGHYLNRARKLAKRRQYGYLEHKIDKEIHQLNERFLLHSEKFSKTLSLYHILIKKKFKKNYFVYGLVSGIGVVAFWHGFWGIFDILHLHPYFTAVFGTFILILTGIFLHEFLGIRKQDEDLFR